MGLFVPLWGICFRTEKICQDSVHATYNTY